MLSSPSTAQILEGLRTEIQEAIIPEVTVPSARLALEMLDNVLSNLAVRAAHEISWMRDEAEQIDALGGQLDDAATQAALAAYRATDRESLHLDDVQVAYDRASEVLSCVVEHAMRTGDDALLTAGRSLLSIRLERELAIMGDWQMIGRG